MNPITSVVIVDRHQRRELRVGPGVVEDNGRQTPLIRCPVGKQRGNAGQVVAVHRANRRHACANLPAVARYGHPSVNAAKNLLLDSFDADGAAIGGSIPRKRSKPG